MIVAVVFILGAVAYALACAGWMVSAAVIGSAAALLALLGLVGAMGAGFYDSWKR